MKKSNLYKISAKIIILASQKVKLLLILLSLAVLIVSIMPFLQAYLLGEILNYIVNLAGTSIWNSKLSLLLTLSILTGLLFSIAGSIQFFLSKKVYKELFHFFAVLIIKNLSKLDIITHENPKKKDLITKVQEHAMWRAPSFVERSAYLLQNIIECLIATFVFFSASWKLGLMIFIFSIPRLLVELKYNNELWKISEDLAEPNRKFWYLRHYLTDVKALTEVKLFQAVTMITKLISKQLKTVKDKEIFVEAKCIKWKLLALIPGEFSAAITIVILVKSVIDGNIEVGTLAFYLSSLATFRWSLNMLSQNIGSQVQDANFISDMFEAFDLKSELPHSKEPIKTPKNIESIEFKDVWFKYPSSDKYVLKGINLKINSKNTLGLVAINGAGKTTMIKLLCRLYDPTKGSILVNGINIKDFELNNWHSKIGLMQQEYNRYECLDLKSAIGFSNLNSKDDFIPKVISSAKAVGIDKYIKDLPYEYDTIVSPSFEKGTDLSGGTHQKVAIARLLFRESEIAIYDESTSAIDGEAESEIFKTILNLDSQNIRILVSHRLYTLKHANQICVLEDGKITEKGSHSELMKLNGKYKLMYIKQQKAYQ